MCCSTQGDFLCSHRQLKVLDQCCLVYILLAHLGALVSLT